jgi:hypothetical protein
MNIYNLMTYEIGTVPLVVLFPGIQLEPRCLYPILCKFVKISKRERCLYSMILSASMNESHSDESASMNEPHNDESELDPNLLPNTV